MYNNIIVHFNPWRFGDEAALITSFFQILADTLKEKLYTRKERLLGFVKGSEPLLEGAPDILNDIAEYSKISTRFVGSVAGFATKAAAGMGKSKSEVSLETLKSRIESFLEKNKKRVVIVVDDIDRLDAEEIRAIFRLVKLTGNFKYATYLLAFDDKLVAEVLAQGFGKNDYSVGYSYLEKIVQVPLRLPEASQSDMESYCMTKVNNLLKDISPEDLERLSIAIRIGVLPALKTPRMVVRFANACSFSLPLMNRLVNQADLILIEALKLFYPKLYDLIKVSKDDLVTVEGRKIIHSSPDYDKEFTEALESACDSEPGLSGSARNLVWNLFPESSIYIGEPFSFSKPDLSKIDVQMRACSVDYFDRYFTYSVAKGDISDIEFDAMLESLTNTNENNMKIVASIFDKYGSQNILYKLEQKESIYSVETSARLAQACIHLAKYFPRDINDVRSFGLPDQLAKLIITLAKKQLKDIKERLLTEAATESEPREFGFNILKFISQGETLKELDVTLDIKSIQEKLLNEIVKVTPSEELIGRLPLDTRYLLFFWNEKDRNELDNYVDKILKKNPDQVVKLIQAFTPYKLNQGKGEINYVNFGHENFAEMSRTITVDPVAKTIIAHFGEEYISPKMHYINDAFEHNTKKILLEQFMALYNESKFKSKTDG